MKGKACSWRDIRKIKHILENMDRLKGEHDALIRCSAKNTRSNWRRTIEVMDSLAGSHMGTNLKHIQPSHAREIARLAEKEDWPQWVQDCEKTGWTVSELRGELLKATTEEAQQQAAKTAPDGKYRTLVVDPPWHYSNKSGRQKQPYSDRTMNLAEIKAFGIQRWIPDGSCHLYLWSTDAYAGSVDQILSAWGFELKVWLVWVKDRIGMGNYYRHQHELCAFATKGPTLRLKRRDVSTVFRAPVGKHSEKPQLFYDIVESCSPGPYLDVFARRRRPDWSVFGDEIGKEYQLRFHGEQKSLLVGGNSRS